MGDFFKAFNNLSKSKIRGQKLKGNSGYLGGLFVASLSKLRNLESMDAPLLALPSPKGKKH